MSEEPGQRYLESYRYPAWDTEIKQMVHDPDGNTLSAAAFYNTYGGGRLKRGEPVAMCFDRRYCPECGAIVLWIKEKSEALCGYCGLIFNGSDAAAALIGKHPKFSGYYIRLLWRVRRTYPLSQSQMRCIKQIIRKLDDGTPRTKIERDKIFVDSIRAYSALNAIEIAQLMA